MRGINLPLPNRGLIFLDDVSFDSLNAGALLIDDVIFPADCCLCKAVALALSTSMRCPRVIVSSGGDINMDFYDMNGGVRVGTINETL